jgi:hypothetical protein
LDFPRKSLERVFGLFSQIHSSERGRSGLGIGLTVVKQLVTLHGGTVHAESAGVGQGSRFRVTLPKTTRAPQAEPLEPPDRIITLFRDNPRVLLVDDQPDIVESLALILRGSGIRCTQPRMVSWLCKWLRRCVRM